MKRFAFTILIIAVFSIPTQAKYSGGTGEPNDPYRIATTEDMQQIGADSNDWNKHFILINDINLAGYTGTQFNIIGNSTTTFTGVFDGNDHKILNFTWSSTDRGGIGLFGYLGGGGQIKNLGLEDVNVNAGTVFYTYFVGGLVGGNGGSISNCYSTGSVTGSDCVGGLVGWNYYSGTITDCHSIGSVIGNYDVGGLIGDNYGTIANCYSTGSVTGSDGVGGLVGLNGNAIANCYSTGGVTGNSYVGGLVGYGSGGSAIITNCYSTGSVMGSSYVGGLVGWNNSGTLTSCYAAGSVTGDGAIGGLVGWNDRGGWIDSCYSTGSVTGNYNVGGLVGLEDGEGAAASFWDVNTSGQTTSAGGEGKTTAEMKTLSTFTSAGWDFTSVWVLPLGQYPMLFLRQAGDLNLDGRVDMFDFAIFAQHWLEGVEP